MLQVTKNISIPLGEIELTPTLSGGPGGQHANKASTAILLQFDIMISSLPDAVKESVLKLKDNRIGKDGVITIQAKKFRSQYKNREDALERLKNLILKSLLKPKKRKKTKPPKSAGEKRIKEKKKRSLLKESRGKIKRL